MEHHGVSLNYSEGKVFRCHFMKKKISTQSQDTFLKHHPELFTTLQLSKQISC